MSRKKKSGLNTSQTEQLKSPLTKQLLEKIKEDFEMEIENSREFSERMKSLIISTQKRVMDETVNTFVRDILTTVMDNWVKEEKRKNSGRRRTDGIV